MGPETPWALETRALRRRFGDLVAVDGIDLQVPRGSFFGFLGPNGAGKSTTLKCLTGLLPPSSGEVRILGLDGARDSLAIRRRIGVLPENLGLFERLTGRENLEFVGRAHGLSDQTLDRRSEQLLQVLGLESATHQLAGEYSHGMRKKLSLALALLPAPRLLFLDEPFEGIDAVTSRQIKGILQAFVGGGGTVFLTSHILDVVERLCDRIAVIHRGRIVVQGPLGELRRGGGGQRPLEEIFLDLVGGESRAASLPWLVEEP